MSLLWSLEVFLRLVLQLFRAYGAERRSAMLLQDRILHLNQAPFPRRGDIAPATEYIAPDGASTPYLNPMLQLYRAYGAWGDEAAVNCA